MPEKLIWKNSVRNVSKTKGTGCKKVGKSRCFSYKLWCLKIVTLTRRGLAK